MKDRETVGNNQTFPHSTTRWLPCTASYADRPLTHSDPTPLSISFSLLDHAKRKVLSQPRFSFYLIYSFLSVIHPRSSVNYSKLNNSLFCVHDDTTKQRSAQPCSWLQMIIILCLSMSVIVRRCAERYRWVYTRLTFSISMLMCVRICVERHRWVHT